MKTLGRLDEIGEYFMLVFKQYVWVMWIDVYGLYSHNDKYKCDQV